jgi:hypothetical protein
VNFKKWLGLTFSILVAVGPTLAAEKGQPLFFPLKLNNVQPLPQKFEYSLRDAYRFLLGNRIIDTSQFEFVMYPSASGTQVEVRWPPNLFESGNISILSPSGVSIWSSSVTEKQNVIKLQNSDALINKLLNLSFFKFCVSQYEVNTGMEVCSPELLLKGSGQNIRAVYKPHNRPASIQINGRPVTPHGIVFLNDEKESLSFRAVAVSGAEFKMDTRSINLEFLDVTSVSDNLMAVTIKGPYPLAPSEYRILKDGLWTVILKKDRALVYIAGAGQVPLRQEFVVQGPLPIEANRLYLEKSSPTKAYASSLELHGWNPQKGTPQAADSGSDVASVGDRFTWSLKNLTYGQDKSSHIQVADSGNVFAASYSFSRALANRLELFGGINSYKTTLYVGGEAQMWLESLPIINRISQQRTGLGLIYNQDLSGNTKAVLMELDFYWRLTRGLQLMDPSFYFGLGLQNWSLNSHGIQTFAPFIGWMGNAPAKLKYFDWQELTLKQSLSAKSSEVDFKSRTDLRWKLYQPLSDQTKLRYSLGIYSESTIKNRSGALVEGAWVMSF